MIFKSMHVFIHISNVRVTLPKKGLIGMLFLVLFQFEGKPLSEDDQLVWAVKEAQKEEERQKQLAIQEENDLKRALQLSQDEVGSSEA